MVGGDPGAVAEGDGALDGRFELADVAGPVVFLQDFEGVAGESRHVFVKFTGVVVPEPFGQELDVGPPVPQRGEHQADHADAMIELLAEPALFDQGGQVFAGRHQEPRLSRLRGMPRTGLVVAELQLAQQVKLQFQGQHGDFIEIECAALGLSKLAGPIERVVDPRNWPGLRRLLASSSRRPRPILPR